MKMDPMLFLSNSSHFGQNFIRTEGNAHVLVAIPEVHAVDPRYGKIQEALLRYVLLDEAVVKLAFSKPLRVARREITLPYTFDGFRSKKSQPSPSKPRREPVPSDSSPTESIHVLEYTE
ncbi:hypothetical protein F444_09404 [Phytophthora nicotianae P1976]|uniref:Uncharacterized protein n=1 Tax=Phytophthora nicotianae P1976 TaxID=1317066 RepID=A0A081A7S8_PHYNI|nr:hypothetical protein F444_09404 [Phytophthora nicotianae P1976]